jgi:hypothetical protein
MSVLRTLDRVTHKLLPVALEFALQAQASFSTDPPRGRVLRHDDRDDSLEPCSFESIGERLPRRLRGGSLDPPQKGKPPSDLRIGMVAPKPHAAKSNQLTAGLLDEFPPAETPLSIRFHLPVDEGLYLLVAPRPLRQ